MQPTSVKPAASNTLAVLRCLLIGCLLLPAGAAIAADSSLQNSPVVKPHEARPISTLGVDIGRPAGLTPRNRAIEDGIFNTPPGVVATRTWPLMTRTWAAPKTRHRPLYFEEINAERYGYTRNRFLQPMISTVHFFGTVPALPYLMAAQPPCQCNYTLGHYRPGGCAPWRTHCWPKSRLGVSAEAIAVVGLIALIP